MLSISSRVEREPAAHQLPQLGDIVTQWRVVRQLGVVVERGWGMREAGVGAVSILRGIAHRIEQKKFDTLRLWL